MSYSKFDSQTKEVALANALEFLDDLIQLHLAYQFDYPFLDYAQLLKSEPSRLIKQLIFNEDGTLFEGFQPLYLPLLAFRKH